MNFSLALVALVASITAAPTDHIASSMAKAFLNPSSETSCIADKKQTGVFRCQGSDVFTSVQVLAIIQQVEGNTQLNKDLVTLSSVHYTKDKRRFEVLGIQGGADHYLVSYGPACNWRRSDQTKGTVAEVLAGTFAVPPNTSTGGCVKYAVMSADTSKPPSEKALVLSAS
jgi:hypothetical protein